MTLFSVFDIPVFWPILVFYFCILTFITLKRQVGHMRKYKYATPTTCSGRAVSGTDAFSAVTGTCRSISVANRHTVRALLIGSYQRRHCSSLSPPPPPRTRDDSSASATQRNLPQKILYSPLFSVSSSIHSRALSTYFSSGLWSP